MLSNVLIDWPARYRQLALQTCYPELQRFYQAGIASGEQTLGETEFVAMDFETTGLDSAGDEIVSIGLVPFTWQRIYCRQARHWLVQPKRNLAEQSIVIHGITHSEVEDAPDLMSVLAPLLEALEKRVVVVHYHAIERPFLANSLFRRINEGIEFALIDTMAVERQALLARRGFIGRLLGEKIGSLRLADCRTRYNLPPYGVHNAMTDALATAELLQAQLRYHYRCDTPLNQLWM
ncbi:3'-5' exonuclease [Pseudoalteromonas sp. BDTF-M6]|uniref:3'-5' exonuclease n=1 Tax=Pseudoalteromonas sp. BDTF-M6 TaxID=2796132 RepID=UPI0032D5A3D7